MSLILAAHFLLGMARRVVRDEYYRSLGMVVLIVISIGTLYMWAVGGWPFVDAFLYSVTTMSMNTPYGGPLTSAAGTGLKLFHIAYTFLSVGVFLIFAMETGRTVMNTYEESIIKRSERRQNKADEVAAEAAVS